MEKEALIRALLVDEPPYEELARNPISARLLEEILTEAGNNLKSRVVSLVVLLPDLNPVDLIYDAYTTGDMAVQANAIAGTSRIDQAYFETDKIKKIMNDAVSSGQPSLQKFAVKTIGRRRLNQFVPKMREQLGRTEDNYLQKLLQETLQTLGDR